MVNKKGIVLLVTSFLALLTVVGCGETITPQAVNTTTAKSTTPPKTSQPKVYKVGQSVKFGDAIITVNSVRSSKGDSFEKPEKKYFLLVNLSVKNTGSEAMDISSMLQTSLKDADNYKYSIALYTKAKGQLDGQVASGQTLRGEVAFDVPASKSYEFIF